MLKNKKYYSLDQLDWFRFVREFRAGMQWEEPYVDINSNSFLSENHRFDEWSRQNRDFINSLNTINELSDYYPPPSDIGMSELIQKVLVEHKIPTDELINELRTNNTLGKVIEYLNDHISIDEERLLYVNRLNKYSHNLFEMNKYDTLSYDGKTTNVNFFESFLNTTNGAIRAPELNFKYDSILSSLDSKNPENVYGFSDMKLLLKNIIWDQNKQIYNKTTIDGLKNRLEKNIELYKIIKSITALKKIENPTESQQSELTNLINQAKHILSNKENLFDSNFKYYFDKNNSLKEIERLKKETDLGQLSFENTDLNYVAKQLDESLEKRDLKESSIIDDKIKDLNDKKSKDLLDLKNQQLQLINGIDVGDVSSYRNAIENYSLTEEQINELNKKIAESTKGGIANTVVGYKNFNGGSRTHIVGAENIVLSQESGVIGNNNNLSREAINTFVLGSNVTTNIPNSVALGKDTTLSAPIATPSHTIAGTQYNFAGIAPVGTISIGAEGKERTLTNLAAGRISNTSTDGINGSQLNAVIETLNGLSTELTTLKNAPKTKAPVIKAGDGLSLTEGDDGSITLSNALTFNSGDGINVNKEGNNITITNTQPLSAEDKTKYDTASTNASSALEKANANDGKINDLTSRVTVNEGNITALTGKVTTVTNTANEALGKANTAVQPDKLKAGDGISVVKGENGDITITNIKSFNNDDKEKLNTAFDKSSTAVQPDSLEAGNGISISKADGKITITNTQPLTTEDKTKYDNASTKAENAIQLDKLKAGNGISVNKAENGEITITNTKAFEDADKEKLNTASTTANNALEKANANEGAINIANGKITANEGKITTQEGKINDLTSRVTANEGNISTLTGKVTTVTNTANEALGKANTNAETINNVSGVANEALGKSNTAVQPDKLKAGDGISVNQAENGEITITNTRESGNGLADLAIEGKDNITVNKDGNKYVISSKALPSAGNTSPKLAVAGDKNIDATIDDNNHVSLKLKDNLDVQNLKSKTINSDNLTAENVNTGNLNAKNVNAEKLIIGGNELGTKGLTVGDININENGIDAGNKTINNVADGEISPNSKQAINGRQLYPIVNQLDIQRQHIQNLDDRVGRVEQGLHKQNTLRKAGNASAMATAGLLQPHKSGQSGITAAVGQYQGQTAVAVGYSALSDNGKYGVKFSLNTNTQKEMGGSAGVGYFW